MVDTADTEDVEDTADVESAMAVDMVADMADVVEATGHHKKRNSSIRLTGMVMEEDPVDMVAEDGVIEAEDGGEEAEDGDEDGHRWRRRNPSIMVEGVVDMVVTVVVMVGAVVDMVADMVDEEAAATGHQRKSSKWPRPPERILIPWT